MPGLAVVVAILLVLACIGTLIWYLNHIGQSLRTAALVEWVADDTMTTLDRVYPDRGTPPDLGADVIAAPQGGVVFGIAHERLVAAAERADCRLEVLWAVGDFVPRGAALVRIAGDPAAVSRRSVVDSLAFGPERTLNEDVAYGIRMLVDIAERTLASGPFADPTTAVQAIDRLHNIMRQIARRPLHPGEYRDRSGTVRLVVPTMRWEGYVRLAFDEIRQAGAGSPQVARRLKSALEDLLTVAPPDRRAPLEQQRALLAELAADAAGTRADREAALRADASGLGSAPELVSPDGSEETLRR